MSKEVKKTRSQVKTAVSDLKIGMYVSQLDKDWLESSFLFQGFLIESASQIKKLQKECAFVYVDLSKSVLHGAGVQGTLDTQEQKNSAFRFKGYVKNLFKNEQEHAQEKFTQSRYLENKRLERKNTHSLQEITEGRIAVHNIFPPKKFDPVEKELSFAKQSHNTTQSIIKDFFQQMETADTIDTLSAEQAIRDSMTCVLRSPDAIQLLTRLKDKNYSSWQRSMSNAVLALSFGRYLNLHDQELITLGLSGLLHDIGYLRMTEAEIEQENRHHQNNHHTKIGYEILINVPGNWAKIAANVAYCHHEHVDGTGFPRGLYGKQVCSYTRIISIIDAYNALIHPSNPQQKKMTHYEAIVHLLDNAKTYYDARLLNSFHQSIGTYPVGCIVEMNNGEIAMVVEVNDHYKLKPKIMLLTDVDKEKCAAKTVDLAELDTNKDEAKYFIANLIAHPEKYGLNELELVSELATGKILS